MIDFESSIHRELYRLFSATFLIIVCVYILTFKDLKMFTTKQFHGSHFYLVNDFLDFSDKR